MAESILAIILVTSSARDTSLVFRWPPDAKASPRLSRALPEQRFSTSQFDNPWRTSNSVNPTKLNPHSETAKAPTPYNEEEFLYTTVRHKPETGEHSPDIHPPAPKDGFFHNDASASLIQAEYDSILGYDSAFLAKILCPERSMCHQKFELVVDGLAFLGHPVCAEEKEGWRFKPEKVKNRARGREERSMQAYNGDSVSSERTPSSEVHSLAPTASSVWLQTFHFVIVLDLPDPSSASSGNIAKYFDIIYEQLAFPITAVLFQEQVLANFVESECDALGTLKEKCMFKGEPFSSYVSQALEISSIAVAMKTLYTATKARAMAYLSIHSLPLELQLPPHLDHLLHASDDEDMDVFVDTLEDDDAWGADFSVGWKLPPLTPWKSLLLLDDQSDGFDAYSSMAGPFVNVEDRNILEGLMKFLETASVYLSLADMATLLDWDLYAQVFPAVRWLVLHRRAKVVDILHRGLRTVFTISPHFAQPLKELSKEFANTFADRPIPSLPKILSLISASSTKHGENHFFASVVKEKSLLPLYHDVVLWMLKRELIITLHLRIRIVAPRELKIRVREAKEKAKARIKSDSKKRRSSRSQSFTAFDHKRSEVGRRPGWPASPQRSARRQMRRFPSNDSDSKERLSPLKIMEDYDAMADDEYRGDEDDIEEDGEDDITRIFDDEETEETSGGGSGGDKLEDNLLPSMISDPSRATPLQRRWLAAMSIGKEPRIAKRFALINQYFDGKKTESEILFRAEITRKQLREVLQHYEQYLQTFLHPS